LAEQIRILVVDDHALFLDGVERLLSTEPGFTVVGRSASAIEALDLARTQRPNIILLDYDLGEEQGLSVLESLRLEGSLVPVLMVTAGINDSHVRHILEMPATGIFLKQKPSALMLEAIRTMLRGETWLDSKLIRPLVTPRNKTSAAGSPKLTDREREVMQAVFEGHRNKDIAFNLRVSESSVKATLQQLFDKAGVRTRSQLVRLALEKHANDWLMLDRRTADSTQSDRL
jgi:two-component system, NarL family, nitrate/nitrite response regulator NarL